MLSISKSRTAEQTSNYLMGSAENPGQDMMNYYNETGGEWYGKGAEILGLHGTMKEEDWYRVVDGFAPARFDKPVEKISKDGEITLHIEKYKLNQNAGREKRRAGHDLTYSSVKSGSVAWSMVDEQTRDLIEWAFNNSVNAGLDVMAEHASFSRIGSGGADGQVEVATIWTKFMHGTSRRTAEQTALGHAPDPNLHIHAFMHNIGLRIEGGKNGTPQPDAWMDATGGVTGLTEKQIHSAEKSYESWAQAKPEAAAKFGFYGYVNYAQEKRAEEREKGVKQSDLGSEYLAGRTLEFDHVFHFKMASGAAQRLQFAWNLRNLGFELEEDSREDHEYFRLKAIPKELEDEFIGRRRELEEVLKELGRSDAIAAQHAALKTRLDKVEFEFHEVQKKVLERAIEMGFDPSKIRRNLEAKPLSLDDTWAGKRVGEENERYAGVLERIETKVRVPSVKAELLKKAEVIHAEKLAQIEKNRVSGAGRDEIVQSVLHRVTATEAVFYKKDVYLATYESLMMLGSKADADALAETAFEGCIEVEKEMYDEHKQEWVLKRGWTTREMLDLEKENVEILTRISQRPARLDVEFVREKIREFEELRSTPERKFSLTAEQKTAVEVLVLNPASQIEGDAGSGKTTMLAAANHVLQAAGQTAIGASPLGQAAEEMQAASGIPSVTIQRRLMDIENGRLVLTDKHHVMVDEAGRMGTRHYNSLLKNIEASGAGIGNVGDRKQTQSYDAGNAFTATDKVLAQAQSTARLKEIYRQKDHPEFLADVEMFRDGRAVEGVLSMLQRGEVVILATEKDIPVAIARDAIAKQDELDAHQGKEPVILGTNTNREAGLINAAAREELKAMGRLADERIYKTGTGEPMAIATGERLMNVKNDYGANGTGLSNGNTVRVIALGEHTIRIREDRVQRDGTQREHEVSPATLEIKYGYAATVPKNQGATTDRAGYWVTPQSTRENAYTAITRAREGAKLYFSKETVEYYAKRAPVPKEWADVAREIEKTRVKLGQEPKLEAADYFSFREIRNYMLEHASDKLADGPWRKDSPIAELHDSIHAMSRSVQKENALDWRIVEKENVVNPPEIPPPARELSL
ncbi:conjugative relaxase-like TrwC/TraI family protein [Caballeronia udeis]|uniref:Conjugative relaxase-like TrwC/TraI family protein n=1 Tax=Caballeronia udeis TaxID=1232866 RepID=A0ABW8MYM8_9BURK